ncbi:MAG: glycosyltransferase family 2 protein [Patescibacteria group bacterium]
MISAVVLTRNEEKNIGDCLESLKWCDEIVVIDDFSEDKTVEEIKNLKIKSQKLNSKVKILERHLIGDYAAQRNYGLSIAKGEWIFFVDSDERVSPSLREEIIQLSNNPINQYDGFYIKRRDFIWGRELRYGETANIKLLRLARKNIGEWRGKVHEVWNVKGETGELKNPLLHYPHQTISEFLREINYYSDLRSKELYDSGIKSNFLSIVIYTKGKFIINYFIKLGFLDGIPGLVLALLMSFHSFLARGKLWNLWQRK